MGSAKTVELNQKQVLGVTKYLYDFEQKKEGPAAPQEGDYAKFFRETKEMGKYKSLKMKRAIKCPTISSLRLP